MESPWPQPSFPGRLRAPPPPGRSRTCLRCSGQPPGARPVLPGRLIRPGSLLRCPLQARGDGGSTCPSGACAPKLAAFPRLNGCLPGLTQTSLEPRVHTANQRGWAETDEGQAGDGGGVGWGGVGQLSFWSVALVTWTTQCLSALPGLTVMILCRILGLGDASRWRSESGPSRTCLTAVN